MKRLTMLVALGMLVALAIAGCNQATPAVDTTALTAEPADAATDTAEPTVVEEQAAPTPTATEPAPTEAPTEDVSPQSADSVLLFLVALEAEAGTGDEFGCGDALVPVEVAIDPDADPLEAALSELLAIDEEFYGQSGLYHSLYQSDLEVAAIQYEDDLAIVALEGEMLLGGTCDTPRVREQLTQTALQFDAVDEVQFLVNGEPLNTVIAGEPVQEPTPGGPATEEQVFMYMVARDDNGQLGRAFGCNDSLMPVLIQVDPTVEPLDAALRRLVGVQNEFYGQTELYNALNQSELRLVSANVDDGVARIDLEGAVQIAGECDLPRFRTQLEQTALQFDDVDEAQVFINGEPLDVITGGGQGGLAPEAQTADVVRVYLVAASSGGGFGCDDSLVAISREIDTPGTPLQSALEALFNLNPSVYEDAGLYNVFANSDLTVDGINIDNGTAEIELSGELLLGGVCDNPRVMAQLEATATQFDTVDSIEVTLNGEPLEDVLSLRG